MTPIISEKRLANEEATKSFAVALGALLQPGDQVALEGSLGAGKTTFSRHLICALSGEEVDVPSPTFTLVQTYETPKGDVWHFDLYRLEEPTEIWELGFEEALSHISLIEWSSNIASLALLDNALTLTFHLTDVEGARVVTLQGNHSWWQRLEALDASL
ncbi:MAG: tRNA (adenosine(37)-N6)-threonylcarbamoyltransferase complex ATPase subunit type 1 TsaE [Proteobacteria bacterium]|nr:tRNA (adenosine(37)-N6)-threonylcarbamoyltransferase complex ATPase subunit type 1 TsaE [Pseudomonadota bacterium]